MNQNTVFVIGAGAGPEVEMPTGNELKREISKLLNIRVEIPGRLESGDYVIYKALNLHVRQPDGREGDINPFLNETWHICDALPQAASIDNFIETQRGNDKLAFCGKLAIVRSILDAEKKSLLYSDELQTNLSQYFKTLENIWYNQFFQLLIGSSDENGLKERFESITLIIFNYL